MRGSHLYYTLRQVGKLDCDVASTVRLMALPLAINAFISRQKLSLVKFVLQKQHFQRIGVNGLHKEMVAIFRAFSDIFFIYDWNYALERPQNKFITS